MFAFYSIHKKMLVDSCLAELNAAPYFFDRVQNKYFFISKTSVFASVCFPQNSDQTQSHLRYRSKFQNFAIFMAFYSHDLVQLVPVFARLNYTIIYLLIYFRVLIIL